MRSRWKAGCIRRRWRRCIAPSLVSSPWPSTRLLRSSPRLFVKFLLWVTRMSRISRGSFTRNSCSPAVRYVVTSPYVRASVVKNSSGFPPKGRSGSDDRRERLGPGATATDGMTGPSLASRRYDGRLGPGARVPIPPRPREDRARKAAARAAVSRAGRPAPAPARARDPHGARHLPRGLLHRRDELGAADPRRRGAARLRPRILGGPLSVLRSAEAAGQPRD